jgi:hypothetical protein
MRASKRIERIENQIRFIFKKQVISQRDVIRANKLIDEWKLLTKNTEDTTKPTMTHSKILDEEPLWHKWRT